MVFKFLHKLLLQESEHHLGSVMKAISIGVSMCASVASTIRELAMLEELWRRPELIDYKVDARDNSSTSASFTYRQFEQSLTSFARLTRNTERLFDSITSMCSHCFRWNHTAILIDRVAKHKVRIGVKWMGLLV